MARGRHRSEQVSRRSAVERVAATRSSRRSRAIAPWVVVAIVLATVVSGTTFGYLWVTASCGGSPVELSIAASPDQAPVVESLAEKWQDDAPEIDGRCAEISVRAVQSAEVANSLTTNWKADSDEPRIDVWMPDSSIWVQSAAARTEIAEMVSNKPTLIAKSPVVMALPKPMAEALGWPDKVISWAELAKARVAGTTWARYQHADWGPLKIGIGDPRASFAALGTLLSVADADGNNAVAEAELGNALVLSRASTVTDVTADAFIAKMRQVTSEGALKDAGPFPATEAQVAAYDNAKPKVPLVAVNPLEGTVFADYQYLVLKADWVDSVRQQVAAEFLKYLQGDESRKAYGAAGFRDPQLSTQYAVGLDTELGMGQTAEAARELPEPKSVTQTVGYWTALQRRANLLAVIDSSGSMAEPAPDGSGTRMQVVQQACLRADALFHPESSVGSWRFSTNLDGDKDYEEMVPIGPVGGQLPDGTPRRDALDASVYRDLQPEGSTGLYDTLLAAYKFMQENWLGDNRLNLLVLMTDGKNEDPDGISQQELIQQLRATANPDKPIQVLIIGYGPDTDLVELKTITNAVGGNAYPARTGADIEKVFLATLIGRES
ncbi:substrate-binding and VWA domain-containing protein [Cryptosporangium aurantiacum]|uniref:Ca-activated chloride channel family protein n=1 Tax=Cryptosporangium aurantiacum TaxID=134849 RepID=A0A1M7QEF3_9ACTN|nr:substrate-binding and VWA domain-containing protein [Cryptosporangium aurantiacum]SHN29233.1 Ca-activated chloride channel family protein [Cryptosporangium aurantiacum]